ncbi:MAG: hypothetical protein JWQ45_706 [Blastococcus sp.]|nr:hypothetical protein [Blastococcus sp.]
MLLVVGATGQLGSLIVRELARQGRPVRAMVRPPDLARDLVDAGAELVEGDLLRPETLDEALRGVRTVLATANAVAPVHRGDDDDALARGYASLIARARTAGVERFVYASVPETPLDDSVPMVRAKRVVERLLEDSGISYASVRMPPFTEIWLALAGSSIPLRGEARPTLARAYPFLRRFRRLTGTTVERHGVMVVPGPATTRNAFLSLHDAARIMTALVDVPDVRGPVDIGGPEVLTWTDVARIFADVLGRPVRVLPTPVRIYAAGQLALSRVAPSASAVLGLNRLIGTAETPWNTSEVSARLGVHGLRTAERILRDKAALPVGG